MRRDTAREKEYHKDAEGEMILLGSVNATAAS
jgi:hypothetical protein